MEKSLVLVFLVIYASIYITECSLSILRYTIYQSHASLQTCQTCLLEVAGATRLIPMKNSPTENSELVFLVDGPMIFYSHVELLCSKRSLCGYMKLDRSGAPITQDVTSKQFMEKDGAQYHCLMKTSVSHTASCAACLMETSETEMMGHFLVHVPQRFTLHHMYILYTSKEPSKIVVSCQSRQFCHGLTVILPTNDCDLFRKSVPVKGMNRLPLESSGGHRLGEKVALYDTDTRNNAAQSFVSAIKQLTTMDRYCFNASSVEKNKEFCTTCMLNGKNRIILAVRTATGVDQVEASEAHKKSSVQHLFCLFTNEKVDWENLKSLCGGSKDSEPDPHRSTGKKKSRVSPCGTITPVGSGDDYSVPFDSQFYSFINKPVVKRLGNQISNAELCFWVQEERKQKEQPNCLDCLFTSGMKLELSLSAALLTTTKSKVLDCLEDHSQCHPLRDVPIAMCQYEKELQLLALEESKRDVIPDLDLNKEPHPDRHTFALKESKRDVIPDLDLNKEPPPDRHPSRVETERTEKTTSYFTGTTPLVIHFYLDEEIELFKCYECVLLYKEVLLMSVKRAYLWITNSAKGMNDLSSCSEHCRIKQVPSQNQFYFENFERLQPLSINDVVFIFCGHIALSKRDKTSGASKRVGKDKKLTTSKDGLKTAKYYKSCISSLESRSRKIANSNEKRVRPVDKIWEFPTWTIRKKRKKRQVRPDLDRLL
nr:CCG45_Ex1 [Albugo candida]